MDDTSDDVSQAVISLPIISGEWIISDLQVARRKQNPLWWQVKLRVQEMIWPDNQPIPTARASMLSSSYDEQSENYFTDTANKTVTTSAGELFESLPTRLTGCPILQVEKNFESYSMAAYDAIKYTTNASAITIAGTTYAPDTLLFKPPSVQQMVENVNGTKYNYFKVTFRLACDVELHVDSFDDRGYIEINSSNATQPILKPNFPAGLSFPWPLDGSGHSKTLASDLPAVREFHPYASVEWGIDFS